MLVQPITRVDAFTPEAVDLHAGLHNIPVVFSGAAKSWPAMATWSLSSLKRTFGNVSVPVRDSDDEFKEFFEPKPSKLRPRRMMKLAAYIDVITNLRPEGVRPPYAGNISANDPAVRSALATLSAGCAFPRPSYPDYREEYRLWVGADGQRSTIHNDPMDNFNVQISGKKRFLLFSPRDHNNVYAQLFHAGLWASPVDPDNPDLEAYPLFRGAQAWSCELTEGDILYIPIFWFHATQAITPCVNINRWVGRAGHMRFWHLQPEAQEFISPEAIIDFLSERFAALPPELQELRRADHDNVIDHLRALIPASPS
jgi:hypothetical protein